MAFGRYVLALDQGTSGSTALVVDAEGRVRGRGYAELPQHYPHPGWVEHDPEQIWATIVEAAKSALASAGSTGRDVAAIGITNQRETTIVWERATGKPIHHAIVWQDRRTADFCAELKSRGMEKEISARTGLVLDPYFSATKIAWILDSVPGARERAARGELAFGTVDSFLLWRLTGGAKHATDATNASRSLVYDLRTGGCEQERRDLFGVPQPLMPEIKDSAAEISLTDPALF